MPVFVVGSVNADVALPVVRLPTAGATVLAGSPIRSGGGKGANVAVAAARDGADVRLVAAVGADLEGERSLADLRDEGVGTAGVVVLDGEATGLAMICVDRDGENLIVVAPGANAALRAEHVAEELTTLGPDDLCVVNFEIPEPAVDAAAAVCADRGARLLVNASPVRELSRAVMAARPALAVNRGELAELAGEDDVREGARRLAAEGAAAVIVTLGADGAHVLDEDGRHHDVAPHAARPVDTTGAGDTFTGVLAGALARGDALPAAARRAAVAGALSTEAAGARTGMPRSATIDAAPGTAEPARGRP